jgi:mannose-1-phosphate guanylyltransferase/mannose-6-phosphate isomerase
MQAVVLAGGRGSRLWPLSRRAFPKQFLHFGDTHSLLQKTLQRCLRIAQPSDLLIVTQQDYYHLVKKQALEMHPALAERILVEPEPKNTGPAITLALESLADPDACVLVCPSDHVLSPDQVLLHALLKAEEFARQGHHVIFGIRPHAPETGYGYIQADGHAVKRFVEKPDRSTAETYLMRGDYLWNSGLFLFHSATYFADVRRHCPELLLSFAERPERSIDYALLEKSDRLRVMPLDLSWSDVGSWDSVYDVLDKDARGNATCGHVHAVDTDRCLIMGGQRLIATMGLEELLIVETDDALFIGKRGESQRMRALVDALAAQEIKQVYEHREAHRPWGSYTVLETGPRYKIKRISVAPQQRLSLQRHYHRSEHWTVVQGTANVVVGERELLVHENESVYVPKSAIHRLENPGKVPLEIIEVQVGEYLSEDDIVRYDDVYGRA